MELQNNSADIYQFTLILAFSIALIFFIYIYWFSIALRKTALEREKAKQQILEKEIDLMKSKLEKEQLENERRKRNEENLILEQEILLKNKELTTSTLLINQHNSVLKKISTELDTLKTNSTSSKTPIREIKKLIRSSTNFENNWDDFKLHFENVHPDFFIRLNKMHPNLSQTDSRHCAYIKMKLSTKEIARLMGISATSVQMSRVRLKKKMSLVKEVDLRNYVVNL
ncbi:MAG: helix-turn-helix transcriptional regulator [Saprospiraceae bacterium]